jgi:rhodanese-related sulfurtransferase
MSVIRVQPREAAQLVAAGHSYVDVRSVPEFDAGHAPGAFNVPLLHLVPGRGMVPNPEFMAAMEKRFPRDAQLVIGCKAGGRSNRAAELLLAAGWTKVVDMAGGWEGEPGVLGWRVQGLPVEATAAADHTWEGLK